MAPAPTAAELYRILTEEEQDRVDEMLEDITLDHPDFENLWMYRIMTVLIHKLMTSEEIAELDREIYAEDGKRRNFGFAIVKEFVPEEDRATAGPLLWGMYKVVGVEKIFVAT